MFIANTLCFRRYSLRRYARNSFRCYSLGVIRTSIKTFVPIMRIIEGIVKMFPLAFFMALKKFQYTLMIST